MTMSTSPQRPRVYIASPYGFSPATRLYYYQVVVPLIANLFEVEDPWSYVDAETVEHALATLEGEALENFWLDVGEVNIGGIDRSDIVIAFLDGQEVDSGTASEVGYASGTGKKVFGIRMDTRESGETGMKVNLQVAKFIHRSGGIISNSLEEVLDHITHAES